MKKENRVRLFCVKRLGNGSFDEFYVNVSADKKDDAKKEYERQGYRVLIS